MLYGFFVTVFIIMCFFLVLIILIQKTKSTLGLGNIGGGSQMIFGGSGGQDLFQKITWVLGAFFIGGSLALSVAKARKASTFKYVNTVAKSQDVADVNREDQLANLQQFVDEEQESNEQ
jgi:protein translocase SecG subunit